MSTSTPTKIRVRIVEEGQRYVLRNVDTGQREGEPQDSWEEADLKATEQKWHVINSRPLPA